MSNLYARVEQPWTDKVVDYLNQRADVMVALWMIILFIRLVKLLVELGAVQRLRYYRARAVGEGWRQRVGELAQRMGIRQAVGLLESSLVQVPMMAGVFKPVILVPLGLLAQLPPQQVEAILLHELAHIRRKDYFINLLQSITETIFFFNPAILWISSLIREERENCCDDIAVGESRNKKEFIHALVSFQEYRQSSPYAMAFASNRNHLLERVKRLIHHDNKTLNTREKLFLLISVFITVAITLAYFRPMSGKPVAAQVKAAGLVASWSTAYEDTSKPQKPAESVKAVGPVIKPDVIRPDTVGTLEQKQREMERAFAEQQRKLEEAQVRLKEQELELARQQDSLYDLYAEALARLQDLRDSVYREKSPRARLQAEQERLKLLSELRLENQHNLELLQSRNNEQLLKENQIKAKYLAGLQERKLRDQQRALENQARLQELRLQRDGGEFENATRGRGQLLLIHDENAGALNKHVEPVIRMLKDKKLITRTDELSFSLDKNGLTVNGKKQPEEVFQEFRKAFLEDPQDFILYSKKGGNESTSVNKHKD